MAIYMQQSLENFFNLPVKQWPEKGALIRVICPRSGIVQYIVISQIENTVITTFNIDNQRVMRIRMKQIYGLELGVDTGVLLRDRRTFIGKLQFTKIYAFTRDLDSGSKCQRTIRVIMKDYFACLARVEEPLAAILPTDCIRLVLEYMA